MMKRATAGSCIPAHHGSRQQPLSGERSGHESSHPGRRSRHPHQRRNLIRPKPMVEIGGRPILWHILKIYSQHGINDFIICCGYKGYVIKEFFANYFLHTSMSPST